MEKELRAEEDSEEGAARRRGGGDKAINCGNIRRIVLSLPLSSSLACSLALWGCAGPTRMDLWPAFFSALHGHILTVWVSSSSYFILSLQIPNF